MAWRQAAEKAAWRGATYGGVTGGRVAKQQRAISVARNQYQAASGRK